MSADKPCARQTFTVFPRFCLPTKLGPGRHFLHFLDFVCRQTLRLADIYCISSILSADKPCAWQTHSAFPLFYLPTNLVPGRHIQLFLCFVRRQTLYPADIFGFTSVLSASITLCPTDIFIISPVLSADTLRLADIFGFSSVLSANISSSHKSDLLSIVLFQAFPKPAKFLQLFLRYTGIIAMSSEDSHVFQLQIIQKISPVREHRSVIHIRITGA